MPEEQPENKKSKEHRFLQILMILLTGVVPRGLPQGSNLRKFSSELWLSAGSTDSADGISRREEMLQDLVSSVLPGKDRLQIETLLGPSLQTDYFRSSDKDLIYYLGPQRGSGFNIDSEWLLIWLDNEGRFKKYKIVND